MPVIIGDEEGEILYHLVNGMVAVGKQVDESLKLLRQKLLEENMKVAFKAGALWFANHSELKFKVNYFLLAEATEEYMEYALEKSER